MYSGRGCGAAVSRSRRAVGHQETVQQEVSSQRPATEDIDKDPGDTAHTPSRTRTRTVMCEEYPDQVRQIHCSRDPDDSSSRSPPTGMGCQ